MTDSFPDRSMAHLDKIDWMIETAGWAMEAVDADRSVNPPRAPYTYSIGFETAYRFGDVVVFGMTPANARGLLGLVADLLASGVEPPIGPAFLGLLDNDMRCALLPVDLSENRSLFSTASQWYGSDFRMAQLAWPDRNGFLPWEAGFDRRMVFAQPLIGSTAEVA